MGVNMSVRTSLAASVAVAAMVAAAGTASATPYYSPSYYSPSYHSCCSSSSSSSSSEAGAVATESGKLQSTTNAVGNIITNRISNLFSGPSSTVGQRIVQGPTSGVSTGDANGLGLSVWSSLGRDWIGLSSTGYNYAGQLSIVSAGADYKVTDNLVVGAGLFYDHSNLNTYYNVSGNNTSNGYSLVPYIAYSFGQGTTIDAMAGITYTDSGIHRANDLSRGTTNGYRYMMATNLHHTLLFGDLSLRGDVGYSISHSRNSSYHEGGLAANTALINAVSSHLATAKIGGRAAYTIGMVQPFFSTHYLYDTVRDHLGYQGVGARPSNDRDEVLMAIGVDVAVTDQVQLGVEAHNSFFRDQSQNTGFLVNGRFSF